MTVVTSSARISIRMAAFALPRTQARMCTDTAMAPSRNFTEGGSRARAAYRTAWARRALPKKYAEARPKRASPKNEIILFRARDRYCRCNIRDI